MRGRVLAGFLWARDFVAGTCSVPFRSQAIAPLGAFGVGLEHHSKETPEQSASVYQFPILAAHFSRITGPTVNMILFARWWGLPSRAASDERREDRPGALVVP
jgi:hypothetical protein